MTEGATSTTIVRTGVLQGLGRIYDASGRLNLHSGEAILMATEDWDMQVKRGWRRLFPDILFMGFNGPVSSKLYVTSDRIVLIRDIDVWRETKGDMTPLGIPDGVAKVVELRRLAALGAREYCEIDADKMSIFKMRRLSKGRSWMNLYLVGDDGNKYEILIWKGEGVDEDTASLVESRFKQ